MDQATPQSTASTQGIGQGDVHNKIGLLTRQLHDALRELGYADRLRDATEELPDAQNRLSYIARLTGEAAEKVLTLVDDAKGRQTDIVAQTKKMRQAMIADPVAAVAKGHIMNYLEDMEKSTEIVDNQLTEIMMAQDFHDLTGQVIAKVVHLASNLEQQLVELLLLTAPQLAQGEVQLDQCRRSKWTTCGLRLWPSPAVHLLLPLSKKASLLRQHTPSCQAPWSTPMRRMW